MDLTAHDNEIEELAQNDKGYLLSRDVTNANIPRIYLTDYMIRHPEYERIVRGVYVNRTKVEPDHFYIFSLNKKDVIFSHLSALYLLGIYNPGVQPTVIDVTFKHGYNRGRIQGDNNGCNTYVEGDNINAYVCSAKFLRDGVVDVVTSLGHTVSCYCAERAICELIHDRKQYSSVEYKAAIKSFFASSYNGIKLVDYSRVFKVNEKVMDYLTLLD